MHKIINKNPNIYHVTILSSHCSFKSQMLRLCDIIASLIAGDAIICRHILCLHGDGDQLQNEWGQADVQEVEANQAWVPEMKQ